MVKTIVYMVADNSVANKFGTDQIKSLVKRNLDVYLVTGVGDLNSGLVNLCTGIYQCKNLKRNISLVQDLISCIKIIFFIHKISPNIIIYATPKASFIGSIAAKICGVEVRVFQIWGARWETLKGLKHYIVREMDKIVIALSTHSLGVSKSIAEIYGQLTKKKITVLGLGSAIGVDSSLFCMPSTKSRESIIGYAGRLALDKGILELYLIFKRLKISFPDLQLELIGDLDISDPISSELLNQITDDPCITWVQHSSRDILARHMKTWDLQLLLSLREGLGNVIIEASACGVQTVCWAVTGTTDAVPKFLRDNLIPKNDLELFFNRVKFLLAHKVNSEAGTRLSKWTIENFENKKVLKEFCNYIDSIKLKS